MQSSECDISKTLGKMENGHLVRAYLSSARSKSEQLADQCEFEKEQCDRIAAVAEWLGAIAKRHADIFAERSKRVFAKEISGGKGSWCIVFQGVHSNETIQVCNEGGARWRLNGVRSSVGDMASRLGLTADYMNGLLDGLNALDDAELHLSYLAEKAADSLLEQLRSKFCWATTREDVKRIEKLTSCVGADSVDELAVRKLRSAMCRRSRAACAEHRMPSVPPAKCCVSEACELKKFSGIYFGWRDGVCFYVGKSVNVPSRLRSHHKLCLSDDVSWIEFPVDDIHFAELFYIWLLEPCENSVEGKSKLEV